MTEPKRSLDSTGRKRLRQTKLDFTFKKRKTNDTDAVTNEQSKTLHHSELPAGTSTTDQSESVESTHLQKGPTQPVQRPKIMSVAPPAAGGEVVEWGVGNPSQGMDIEPTSSALIEALDEDQTATSSRNVEPTSRGSSKTRKPVKTVDKRHSWTPGEPVTKAGPSSSRVGRSPVQLDHQSLENLAMADQEEYNSSQSLFSESDSQEESQTLHYSIAEPVDPGDGGVRFGTTIDQLQRAPDCSSLLPLLRPAQDFTILFRTELSAGVVPRPFPEQYQDRWDSVHVRMPCSKENLYPVKDSNGKTEVKSRWDLIQASLLNNMSSSVDLEESILAYNTRYSNRWNFEALHRYFTEVLNGEETVYFFQTVLPGIVQLALELPKLCTQPMPLLKKQMNHTILLSQQQIAALLANALFCTFPRRNAQLKRSEYSTYPDINFNRLFDGRSTSQKKEKLKCIINYFRRVVSKTPSGTLSFTRRALRPAQLPDWVSSQAKLGRLHVSSKGSIETDGTGMLQLDFANAFIGGGVLGHGCVQEEIRFLICPELIVSRLFTEVLAKNECLVIKGAEQYSSYSGYANTFRWTGNHDDTTVRDEWGRRETEIVAIDAIPPNMASQQYQLPQLNRELNKAYCGFRGNHITKESLPAIATGNWGCGAFGGNPRLKALLQLMAAAEAKRDMAYFTFHDSDLCRDIHNMHEFLLSQDVSVGELLSVLCKYSNHIQHRQKKFHPKLYPFIFEVFTNYDSDTDDDDSAAPQEQQNTDASPDYKVDTP